ncbi:MAG TPA: monofunctional biosynthetic peptidoglycan transglycosylase [Geminicoccaceae bacterium]
MPWQTARQAREREAGTGQRRKRAGSSGWRRRLRRWLAGLALVLLLAPAALILAYRLVPVPLTPLMVIRLLEGEGLAKEWVPLERIAPALPEAVVAAEDNLFCEHGGFDLEALEAEIEDWLGGGAVRGASTITMQTAKNLFLWPDRSLLRKAIEAWLTPQIELLWPKARIIEVYLNVVEFGPGIYGAEAAAWHHFRKPASDLAPEEAALLAAVLPNPREWSASRPGEYVRSRVPAIRNRVGQLGPMLDCVRTG